MKRKAVMMVGVAMALVAGAGTGDVFRVCAPGCVKPTGWLATYAQRLASLTNDAAEAADPAPMATLAHDLFTLGTVTNADVLERLVYNMRPKRTALAHFTARMWAVEAATGSPVALLLGPSRLEGMCRGKRFSFETVTDYPFRDEITFVFRGEEDLPLSLGYRMPGWCLHHRAGHVMHERRTWHDGDTFTVKLRTRLEVLDDGNLHRFVRGAVVFALPLEPNAEWNWAVDLNRYVFNLPPVRFTGSRAFPFDEPPLTLDVTGDAVTPWGVRDTTGRIPRALVALHPLGKTRTLHLVPVGATDAALVDFPDLDHRK